MRYWKKFKDKSKLHADRDAVMGMVVATYHQRASLECLLQSFLAQTHSNFQILVVHDGPWEDQHLVDLQFRYGSDQRFAFVCTPERKNVFGHNCRQAGLSVLGPSVDYIGTCNGDVYYAPTYFEWHNAVLSSGPVFSYTNMIHSHLMWQPMKTQLLRGKIDVGCWMADRDLVMNHKWKSHEFHADWLYISAMTKGLKPGQVAKIDGYLYVHS